MEDLYDLCVNKGVLKMKIGETMTIIANRDIQRGEVSKLSLKLTRDRKEANVGFSILRNERSMKITCFYQEPV